VQRHVSINLRGLVRRDRVLALLDGWADARVISIVAPSGYGKSTLAAQWLSTLNGPNSSWIALESDGMSVPQLALALGEALQEHLPGLAEPLAELRAGRLTPAQMEQALTTEFRRLSRHLICILDDYHLITDPETHRFVQQILDRGSDQVHLVLISRTQPPLQFSRLLLRGAAITLDQRDLRIDHEEFLTFAHASRLAALSDSQRDEIERRAEGWIAALRLIELSIPRSTSESVEAILGLHSGRLLIEHLEVEVFDRLSEEIRTFLVEAAQLPFLHADLLAAATGRHADSCEMLLQKVVDANLFISAYVSGRQLRYQIHPLFREMLTQIDANVQRSTTIRRRAAAWLAAHDSVDHALALLLPNFPDDAADILAGGALREALLKFDIVTARRWLAQIPPAAIDARPQLATDATWLVFLAEETEMNRAADRAMASLAAHSDEAVDAELRAEAALLRVFGRFLNGQTDTAHDMAQAALQLPCAEFGLAAGYRCMLPVLLPSPSKSPDDDQRALRGAEAVFRRIGFAHGALETAGLRAIHAQRIGDAEGACAAFENAISVAHTFGRENSPGVIDLHFFYGDHLYGLNRIADARIHLERVIAVGEHGVFDTISTYRAAVCLQLCEMVTGDRTEHFDVRVDALRWREILDANVLISSAHTAWLRIVRDARMNLPEHCRRTFDSFGVHPNDLTTGTHVLVCLSALAGAVFGNAPVDARKITSQLRTLCDHTEAEHNLWLAHRARAVLAGHLLACGDEDGARRTIQPLLARADCRRLILDFPPLAGIATEPPSPIELLSERERDILRWLATDHTNKEIARALCISLHTLYARTQNMYRKLGVHSREEAVRVWRGEEIVDSG